MEGFEYIGKEHSKHLARDSRHFLRTEEEMSSLGAITLFPFFFGNTPKFGSRKTVFLFEKTVESCARIKAYHELYVCNAPRGGRRE